jgi:alkylation response protein AidB-like acyl-CoA dehydrogenase
VEGIARGRLLLASGFAEGKTGQSILVSTLRATPNENGYLLNGTKKPCSLSRSMDLLTASVLIEHPDGSTERGIVAVPADAENLEREPFWRSNILAGAESDALILRDVQVPRQLVFPESTDAEGRQEMRGFLWFELLIAASYLGVASGLVERVLASTRGSPAVRAQLGIELEAPMCALECVARLMEEEPPTPALLNRLMFVRYSTQQAIARCATLALEALGGVAFISSAEVAYLHSACQALHFHPPSLASSGEPLAAALVGEAFELA